VTLKDSEKEDAVLVCVDWGEEGCPSVKRKCTECGREVAMDAKNVEICRDIRPVCIPCIATIYSDDLDDEEVCPTRVA
jgi:hypothetical protein